MGFSDRGEGVAGRRIELMTVEEFAALTRRTPSAVRASIQRGELRACKLGSRRYFIRKADVERMFEERRRG
jgi:excisionase family DNA binding protein